MDANTRACVAYVAGRLASRSNASSIYDYGAGKYRNISGDVSENSVNVYDYERGCHFSGSLPNLYDYGRGAHVELKMNGTDFSGYDYDKGHHFSGRISGKSVSVYDYGDGKYYEYTV